MHLCTNSIELLIAVDVPSDQADDDTRALPLLDGDGPAPKGLRAGRGYDSDHVREVMETRGVMPMNPTRRSRKIQIPVDDHFYVLQTGSSAASTS
jgi:hypothetical protein